MGATIDPCSIRPVRCPRAFAGGLGAFVSTYTSFLTLVLVWFTCSCWKESQMLLCRFCAVHYLLLPLTRRLWLLCYYDCKLGLVVPATCAIMVDA